VKPPCFDSAASAVLSLGEGLGLAGSWDFSPTDAPTQQNPPYNPDQGCQTPSARLRKVTSRLSVSFTWGRIKKSKPKNPKKGTKHTAKVDCL